jgi:hypothetical protein
MLDDDDDDDDDDDEDDVKLCFSVLAKNKRVLLFLSVLSIGLFRAR